VNDDRVRAANALDVINSSAEPGDRLRTRRNVSKEEHDAVAAALDAILGEADAKPRSRRLAPKRPRP
jgi:hypothetical protein